MPALATADTDGAGRTLPMSVYLLFLLGMLMVVTVPPGVLIAHLARRRAPDWIRSHYTFQLRTFWLGLLVLVPGILLAVNLLGYLLIAVWVVWVIARCAVGVSRLADGRAIPEPRGLWLGGAAAG
ncbi:MAG: hypothetical protein JJT90_16975 [Ectothiorhodospiraceae bacterium]|nr:hypothetical protein [Ectothiorhodospiraceae bacterium]